VTKKKETVNNEEKEEKVCDKRFKEANSGEGERFRGKCYIETRIGLGTNLHQKTTTEKGGRRMGKSHDQRKCLVSAKRGAVGKKGERRLCCLFLDLGPRWGKIDGTIEKIGFESLEGET